MLRCYLLCRTSQSNLTGCKTDGCSNMLKVDKKIVGVKGHRDSTDGFIVDKQLKSNRVVHDLRTVEVQPNR